MVLTQWQQRQWPRIERELARVIEALRRLGVERIVLYGSCARGDFNEASDVDLVVIWSTQHRMFERIERVLEVADSDLPLAPLVYTSDEYERLKERGAVLIESVEREGRVLYERPH